ncbi:E3 ubiquitin-protein ligase At4g11680-like [Neltuma alba]|uniref:E3 ubiquitin-protein ligase At4g11680-like n=1 Tax=Neltuma alba TaxID=207710 RepID=UPI0010A2FAFB|nr:E3 ubiquitin-protein ligase At4g11680-like [Prosopis alba]
MNHSNNDGDDHNNVNVEEDPTTACIAAIGIALLLRLMCLIFAIPPVLAVFIFCLASITFIQFWFREDEPEIEHMEDFDFTGRDLEDNEKAVKFLEAFLRALKGKEERGRDGRKKKEGSKNAEGSIKCFGSEEIVELGYRECSICIDDFQKGEKCLVFPRCGHIFHCRCIARWVKLKMKKLTCPVCRCSFGSNANGTGGFRRCSCEFAAPCPAT